MDATPWKYTLLIGLWLISGSSFSTEGIANPDATKKEGFLKWAEL